MKKKIFSVVIIIALVIFSLVVPRIYADDSPAVVSIPNTSPKAGEQLKVYINVENISGYVLSQAILTTDAYLEPVIDLADTAGMTVSNTTFDSINKAFTISSIPPTGVKTICISYTIPANIASGTPINITYALMDGEQVQQETNTIQVTLAAADNTTNQNTQSSQMNSNSSIRSQTSGTRSSSYSGAASSAQTVVYNGSRNNYLSSLSVTGYDLTPQFNKTNNTYFITVSNDVTSIKMNAAKEDNTAVVTVSGNTDLKVGLNKVLISVLAENGDVRYYRVYVTRED